MYSLAERAPLSLRTPYGGFASDGSFVITDPLTPRPWTHVLANETYGLVLSQSGSGFSWFQNCQLARLTRWEQDLVMDRFGRYLYVKTPGSGLVSPTYQPTRVKAQKEQTTYRPGSAEFVRTFADVQTKLTMFVPVDKSAEIWLFEVENTTNEELPVDFGFFGELYLGGAGEIAREFMRLFMETRQDGDTLYAWKHSGLVEGKRELEPELPVCFFRLVETAPAWITDKTAFLGRQGSPADPEAMAGPAISFSSGRWDDPVAGARWQATLAPGEKKSYTLVIGASHTADQAKALAQSVTPQSAQADLEAVSAYWISLLEQTTLKTGDEAVDTMANTWLTYQSLAGRMVARCAYYQQGGAYGYRDQLQDSLLALTFDTELTRAQICRNAEAMLPDGSVMHWWHPGTEIAVKSHHIDTSVWLGFGALAYIDETGSDEILDAVLGYRDSSEKASLLDHILRGVRRPLGLRSVRGLPLIGGGDWNDGLSHVGPDGKGDSVWMAIFLYDVLNRLIPVLRGRGMAAEVQEFETACSDLVKAIEAHGWDGEWYAAGHKDDGSAFGSKSCSQGSIFLNMQTWSVLTGFGSKDRRDQAMNSVREKLVTDYGALLLQPAYSKVDPTIGYITRYAPGLRENGGVYSHASTWAILAFGAWGDHATAWRIALGMLPPLRAELDPELYAAEPYVMPGNVDGPDSPFEGRAGWTWYTGSSAWLKRAILEGLFGVKATKEGLTVANNPLPYERASITRAFRGGTVEIEWSGDVSEATLDGAIYHPGQPIQVQKGQTRSLKLPLIPLKGLNRG